jgi:hypothetical protein
VRKISVPPMAVSERALARISLVFRLAKNEQGSVDLAVYGKIS